MRVHIADLVVATVHGEERYGEIADIGDDHLFAYLITPCNGNYHYKTSATRIGRDDVHEIFPTDGGRYRMEAWLDIGYEFHSKDELYDLSEESDTDMSYITDDSSGEDW